MKEQNVQSWRVDRDKSESKDEIRDREYVKLRFGNLEKVHFITRIRTNKHMPTARLKSGDNSKWRLATSPCEK